MTPEKLFTSVLAAILTAAAILGVIYYFGWHLPEQKRREHEELTKMKREHRQRQDEIDRMSRGY